MKYAEKHGQRETLTEFFINQLGAALGLKIAHSGLILSDDELTFVSQIFIDENEVLRHGSLIIEDCFKRANTVDVNELEGIPIGREQEFYSIDFVTNVLKTFCGKDFDAIFPLFIEMLVFDALIGSMDRHSQNWGVLAKAVGPPTYRFSPIFDTSRSLLWSINEDSVREMLGNDSDPDAPCHSKLLKYIRKAMPCMGPVRHHPKVNKCTHFDFVANLMDLYPKETRSALSKITDCVEHRAAALLWQFPFRARFTKTRKRLILKILSIRADTLRGILQKGDNVHENAVGLSF